MKRLNLLNQKFGLLTVIRFSHINKNKKTVWICECDCGTKNKLVIGQYLTSGNTKSCGCLNKDLFTKGKCLLPDNQSLKNSLFALIKQRAKRDNILFDINIQEFINFLNSNCFYCDKKPSNIINRKGTGNFLLYNGIDRVDNSKGYIEGNCVACCKTCNIKKGAVDLNIVKKIYEFSYDLKKGKENV